eukprot:1152134-Pelagomonas_calceolata.AAC.4
MTLGFMFFIWHGDSLAASLVPHPLCARFRLGPCLQPGSLFGCSAVNGHPGGGWLAASSNAWPTGGSQEPYSPGS